MDLLVPLGQIARSFARRLARFYYPTIAVTYGERIPASGAVLFAANHPNSLLDPAIVGLAARRPVHFFAKAPLFELPVFGALMRALGMVPAYRGMDDKAQVKRNLDSLAAAAVYLTRGEAVGIFPEGKSHDLAHVEQVRSGAARLALQAMLAGARLQVIPLGINYERKERFRSAVWVQVAEPIDLTVWRREHNEEEHKAIRTLTAEIDHRLKSAVVHLHEVKWDPFLPELEILLPPPPGAFKPASVALFQRKRIADAMNYFLETDRPRAEAMAQAIQQHRLNLAAAGLTIESPLLRWRGSQLCWRMCSEAGWLLLGLIPALAGILHHLAPFWLTRFLANRMKHSGRATLALNRLLVGLPVYGAFYALAWWGIAHWFGPWLASLWTLLMPFAGILALHYCYRALQAAKMWRQQLRMLLHPAELKPLRAAQEELCRKLRILSDEYAVMKPRETPVA